MVGYQVQCDGCCRDEDWRNNSKIYLNKEDAISKFKKELAKEKEYGITTDAHSEEEDCTNCSHFKYFEEEDEKLCEFEYLDIEEGPSWDCPSIKVLNDRWELIETADLYYLNAKEDTDYVSICIKEVEIKE